MSEYLIRPAKAEEAAAIVALVRGAHLNPFDLDYRRFLVAVDESGVIGCIQTRHHGRHHELASLVVCEEKRGMGTGTALIRALIAREQYPLYLYCRSSLAPYYRRFGFLPLHWRATPPASIFRIVALAGKLFGAAVMYRPGEKTLYS